MHRIKENSGSLEASLAHSGSQEPALSAGRSVDTISQFALSTFNAYPLFDALGDSIITGPTGNNLRDLRILLAY